MALAKIKKYQIIAVKQHKDKILEILQNTESLDVREINEEAGLEMNTNARLKDLQKTDLDYASLDFAIKLLSPFGKKRGLFAQPIMVSVKEAAEKAHEVDFKTVIEKCTEIEEDITKAKNSISSLQNDITLYTPWKSLDIDLGSIEETSTTKTILGNVKTSAYEEATEKIGKLSDLTSLVAVAKETVDTYLLLTFNKELEKEVRSTLSEFKFTEAELPKVEGSMKDHLKKLEKEITEHKKEIEKAEKGLKKLSEGLDDLKIVHDYIGWEKEKLETEKLTASTDYNFVVTAWIAKNSITKIEEKLNEVTKEYELAEIKPEEGENPPVVLQNSNFMSPFEAVSRIYGLPKHTELDPTPFLAAFFILFFALCLTDAGYGIFMFITMGLALKFFKLPDGIRKLVKLLMYAGIVTFVIGTIFGGWFGLTPDQVPSFLTYTNAAGEQMFLLQKINAINSPITVLILSLALGFIQVTLGVIIKLVHGIKYEDPKESILDSGPWVLMLLGVAFFILASTGALGALSVSLAPIGKWWVLGATTLLILTQGRDKKNIIMKLLSGVLSLYGLVGYMSDILSYSRILALGLATAIIGLAVNIVAELVGGLPVIGWLLMAVVFVGGHIFNLLLNALGSFIHSGRLQFVEFFTKFMEGGGDDFRPFSKKSKYIYLNNHK